MHWLQWMLKEQRNPQPLSPRQRKLRNQLRDKGLEWGAGRPKHLQRPFRNGWLVIGTASCPELQAHLREARKVTPERIVNRLGWTCLGYYEPKGYIGINRERVLQQRRAERERRGKELREGKR